MKNLTKNIIKNYFPRTYHTANRLFQSYRDWIFKRRMARFWKQVASINRLFISHHELIVQRGPFKGMRYIPEAVGSAFIPKILGTYEQEAHVFIDHLLIQDYPLIVNIGCAEGYYAIGLARCIPSTHVYAYDSSSHAQIICQQLAKLNEVDDRVTVQGECNSDVLQDLGIKNALVVCDCEGCEFELLRVDTVPALRYCDILFELHDEPDSERAINLLEQFEETHKINIVRYKGRDPEIYPELRIFSAKHREIAISEFRGVGLYWVFMERRC